MISQAETAGFVSSIGAAGTHYRSDNRVVTTLAKKVYSVRDLTEATAATAHARRAHNATRAQLKFSAHPDIARAPSLAPFVEGVIKATTQGVQRGVIFLGYNRAERSQPIQTWDEIRETWQQPLSTPPVSRVAELMQAGYSLADSFTREDVPQMAEIWRPFGWTAEGVSRWLAEYGRGEGGWACGVRGPTGKVEALAKAESLELEDMTLLESTEWGARPQSRTQGLGTAATIGLNAQILSKPPEAHSFVIFAEANMAHDLPGHRVARRAGFRICGDPATEKPNGVLRQHVTVEGKLRDFLLVQLTPEAIAEHYSPDVLRFINSCTQ